MSEAQRLQINRVFVNIGKAIAAYERTLSHRPGRFDHFVAAVFAGDAKKAARLLSPDEQAGLRLFLDTERTRCLRCHNGPLLTNQNFHNVGTGNLDGEGTLDLGRAIGLRAVLLDEFNCLGLYSDAPAAQCAALNFVPRDHLPGNLNGAYKVPGLRNVSATAPYFHDGRFGTLEAVIQHYRNPPPAAIAMGELVPLELNDTETKSLVAFLKTLDSCSAESTCLQ
ncbi:MAG: hypothetical protein AAGA23_02585 [Pseudomonadota bacterium]